MRYHVRELLGPRLEEVARHYDTHGFFIIEGLQQTITPLFHRPVARAIGLQDTDFVSFLHGESETGSLPETVLQRLSRVTTTPELTAGTLTTLEPLLMRLLGSVIHVSRDYHVQVKAGFQPAVAQGGGIQGYGEVQGQYLTHQDFAGARIPTSPCQLTLWVALNASPDWHLRLFPGSHRYGLLTHEWVAPDDPWLAPFGPHIDIVAEEGLAVVFNSLLLHASSNPGPRRRVSCDIRFFPLCGFLSSTPHVLGSAPALRLRQGLVDSDGPTLQAATRETLAYLGEPVFDAAVPPLSILNWANYLDRYLRGDDGAARHMERLVNVEHGRDTFEVYRTKYHHQPIHTETIRRAAAALVARSPHQTYTGVSALLELWDKRAARAEGARGGSGTMSP